MEQVISILLMIAGFYLLTGLIFAILFLSRGITKIDEGAKGTNRWFKLIISPGVVLFWPPLLSKWRVAAKSKTT
jgi:uncharacterized membrane protein YphA (DoxX/SURF4 family)